MDLSNIYGLSVVTDTAVYNMVYLWLQILQYTIWFICGYRYCSKQYGLSVVTDTAVYNMVYL